MRYQIPIILSIVVLVGIIGMLVNDLYFGESQAQQRRSYAQTVRIAPVRKQTLLESYEAVGTTRAYMSIFIKSRQTVHIEKIHFPDNSFVTKDELLLTLDSSVERAQLDEAIINQEEDRRLLRHYQTLANKQAVSKTKLKEQEAAVRVGDAKVKAARARVDALSIRAPFDGQLGTWLASPGALVTKERTINNLDDSRQLKIDFTIPEAYISAIAPDMQFNASTSAFPGREFVARFDHIKNRVDPVTRAATVRVNYDNTDGMLRPGMLMKMQLLKSREDALVVPEQALVPVENKQFLFTVSADSKAVRKEVRIGRRRPGLVEILDGVQLGDFIVVDGAFKLKPGFPVKVLNPEVLDTSNTELPAMKSSMGTGTVSANRVAERP